VAEIIEGRLEARAPVGAAKLSRRAIAAATVGNALEFYDFITYSFFSIQIGHAFFPSSNAYASLMLSLATFGAGFLTRPIGGVVIGAFSDRVGRRPAMMFSFTLMGVAIVGMALIPPYAKIGIAAPILAVLARMAQGFSLGGEVGPTTAYLLESAPTKSRGLAVSWQGASQGLAATAGGLVGFVLSMVMAPGPLDAYGWRIAFLLGALTIPFGLWVRRGLPETLHTPEVATAANETATTVVGLARDNARIIILSLVVLGSGTIGTYTFDYMTTFAQGSLHMPPSVSFLALGLGNLAGVAGVLLGGAMSDRFGRRPWMIWPNLASLVVVLPIYIWIVQSHSGIALVGGSVLLGFIGSLSSGAFYPAFAESLPKRIRGAAFAIAYASAIALFGGTTQLVLTLLIHITGNAYAPAGYLIVTGILGQIAIMMIAESAPVKARLASGGT
jgi:MFS family permease